MINKDPHVILHNKMKTLVPSMAYDGKMPFYEWQAKAKQKLSELLGMEKFEKCDPMFNIEYKKELDWANEIRFTFQSEENYHVPCHLLIPKNAKGKLPVVICLQGHTSGMHISLGIEKFPDDARHISTGDRVFAKRIIEEGYIALVLEQRGLGECSNRDVNGGGCYNASTAALIMGRTTIGGRVWDVSRAIDILETEFPDIYSGYCICMGNSGGGTATFYASCLEERINASMPSCAVCSFEESIGAMRHCICNFVPHIREYFDMGDLGGLIAPRKLVSVSGELDHGFLISGSKKAAETTRELYRTAGCEDSFRHVIGEEGHRFYADAAWPVLNELIKDEI